MENVSKNESDEENILLGDLVSSSTSFFSTFFAFVLFCIVIYVVLNDNK